MTRPGVASPGRGRQRYAGSGVEVGASIVGTVHMLVYVLLQKDLDIGNMNDRPSQ